MDKGPSTKRRFDLEERTLEFAQRAIRICRMGQRELVNRGIISQLIRSSGSIGANYREANESLGRKDFAMRLRIARKEAKETHYWLQLFLEAKPHLAMEIQPVIAEALELRKILSAIIGKIS